MNNLKILFLVLAALMVMCFEGIKKLLGFKK